MDALLWTGGVCCIAGAALCLLVLVAGYWKEKDKD
jgi:hypothetical protein